jgi:hypothetical protein
MQCERRKHHSLQHSLKVYYLEPEVRPQRPQRARARARASPVVPPLSYKVRSSFPSQLRYLQIVDLIGSCTHRSQTRPESVRSHNRSIDTYMLQSLVHQGVVGRSLCWRRPFGFDFGNWMIGRVPYSTTQGNNSQLASHNSTVHE